MQQIDEISEIHLLIYRFFYGFVVFGERVFLLLSRMDSVMTTRVVWRYSELVRSGISSSGENLYWM